MASAEADAEEAWRYSLGLDDAPPARTAAVAKILIAAWSADVARVSAAAEVCLARGRADDTDAGWASTAVFLDRALALLCAGGADRDREQYLEQLRREMNPDPEPFQWPTRRRRRLRWWMRRLMIHAGPPRRSTPRRARSGNT